VEAVKESTIGRMPVSGANVTSVIGWYTTTVDDDAQDHESNAGGDLHHAENEFNFSVASDSKDLDDSESEKQRNDPGAVIDIFYTCPEFDDIASCGDFERKYSEPADAVLPSTGEAPRRVDKSANVHGESAVDRVHDGHFGKRLHHQVDHDADDYETDNHCTRASSLESTATSDEKTGSDSTADGNHLHVSALQVSVQLALISLDNADILGFETELAATQMVTQWRRVDGIRLEMFLRIREREAFSASAHLCKCCDNKVACHSRIESGKKV